MKSSAFKVNISNKAKLLYFLMFASADDKGFVDTTDEIIQTLTDNDKEFDNSVSLELLDNTYQSALQELLSKGYLYEFVNKHKNKVYLIRHWFLHQKLVSGYSTNYMKYYHQVSVADNEYILKKEKPLKEKDNSIEENSIEDNSKSIEDEMPF